MVNRPNILFIMCDQLRADAIAALGNKQVRTPNMDRLVRRGVTFTKGYSSCPVCVPARYTIRTGCEPFSTGIYQNGVPDLVAEQPEGMEERCGSYLARTLADAGYRTFGIGKFHTHPQWNEEVGFEVQLYSEELFDTPEQRREDAYASFIAREHPEYAFIEQLHGERTDMYYTPQTSSLPAEYTVEGWAADRAVEQLQVKDDRPYFGFVSFIGPHPPVAPPIPYNRLYNPDDMPNPIKGELELDHMDEQIPWMNHLIWAEGINDFQARAIKARYYGEITYIDHCLGRILDQVESRGDGDNTVICFFSDHGDHLGDHHAWQKESFFEASCHVPFLVSWPDRLPENVRRKELVCLTDLFGIATTAAGCSQIRDGVDVLGILEGKVTARKYVFGYHGVPGTPYFKIMVRNSEWKYIFMANGGREQLFHVADDPAELHQRINDSPEMAAELRAAAVEQLLKNPGTARAVKAGKLETFEFVPRPLFRIHQFDLSRGITDFGL